MWKTRALPEALERAFAAPTSLTVSQFAPTVFLGDKQSPGNPGFYQLALVPYAVGMLDSWHESEWDEEHWIKSAQCGITEVVLMIVRYIIAHDPVNGIYAIDSSVEVKKIAKVRLIPTLRNLPAAAEQMPEDEDDITSVMLNLRAMVLHFLGSYAEGAFENKAVAFIILDEFAKHLARPGSPNSVTGARERFKTLKGKRRKLYSLTKPGEQRGPDYEEYMEGTRDKFHVPCPHCGHRQELVFEQLQYDHCLLPSSYYDLARVVQETWYRCIAGGCRIEHWQKAGMMARALDFPNAGWVHTNTDTGKYAPQPRKRSRHISDLYSAFCTWGDIVEEYIKCGDKPEKLAAFRIGRLGLWPDREEGAVTEQALRRLARPLGLPPYLRKALPLDPRLVSIKVDVQGSHQKWVTGGFNARGDFFVCDYGMTTDFGALLEVGKREITCLGGVKRVPQALLIDEGDGNSTNEVRQFVAAADDHFEFGAYSTKGARTRDTKNPIWRTQVNLPGGGTKPAYFYRDFLLKRRLYIIRIKRVLELIRKQEAKKIKAEEEAQLGRLPKLWLPSDVGENFLSELSAERLAIVDEKEVWLDPVTPNDWGDCVKLCDVLWHCLGGEVGGEADESSVDESSVTGGADRGS